MNHHPRPSFALVVLLNLALWTMTFSGLWAQGAQEAPLWQAAGRKTQSDATGPIRPAVWQDVVWDANRLTQFLAQVPHEASLPAASSPFILALPMPNGELEHFRLVETPVMHKDLQAQFPDIRCYTGAGIERPHAVLRFDQTPFGFHAMVLSEGPTYYMDPVEPGVRDHHMAYWRSDFYATTPKQMQSCEALPGRSGLDQVPRTGKRVLPMGRQRGSGVPDDGPSHSFQPVTGNQLRTYQLALACTGEYAAYHGGTVAGALAAMNTSMNRINGIYERDFAIRMTLVPNNTAVIFLNAGTDPYSNSDGVTMLGQNQTTCDNLIGASNYDIGHVFSTGGGGVAYLQAPCTSYKAGGVTGSSAPVGDPFDVDYVAHEMGHQFGANHTQNNSCNRVVSAAYEPGSASTIMGYAGICAPNLQNNSDDHFHNHSYNEILAYSINGAGSSCATITSTGNIVPTVEAGTNGLYIPKSTPFELTAVASDGNGDALTYNWEEYDLGPATASGDNNLTNPSGTQPIFRSWPSNTSPTRTFPRPLNLVANTTVLGEHMPSYTRELKFKCTVRDNRAGGGGVAQDLVTLQVTGNAGPFVVTAPNTAVNIQAGVPTTITWNVASTNLTPVNCSTVNIFLSTDGGYTWPHQVATGVPNSGTASVTLPNVPTNQGRIKVKAAGNYFFDISNTNFTVLAGAPGCTNPTACNYSSTATSDNGSCVYATGCDFCQGGLVADGDSDNDGICNNAEVVGCQNPLACNFNPNATDSGNCLVASGCDTCSGGLILDGDSDNDGVCNGNEIVGCQNASACNFNPAATDYGNCTFTSGCATCVEGTLYNMDLNGNGWVEVGDVLAMLGAFGCTTGGCAGDLNGDGATNVTDLLLLLGAFGQSCD